MTWYRFYLTAWKNRRKRVRLKAANCNAAMAEIKSQYPGWEISMYWPEWKPKMTKSRLR